MIFLFVPSSPELLVEIIFIQQKVFHKDPLLYNN